MKQFLIKVFIFISLVAIYPMYRLGYNIYYDPFGVIRGDMENQYTEPNQRYLKVKHLVNNPNKYDSYIFGSSRAGKIDPLNIDEIGKWYNLSYSEGIPAEHLEDLRLMVKRGVTVSKVIIGLDNICYLVDPRIHLKHVLKKRYINSIKPLGEFLFLKPDKKLLKQINKIKEFPEHPYFDIYETGQPRAEFKDKWATSNPEKHRNAVKFEVPTWENYYKSRVNEALYEIKMLIQFCKENNIESIVYISPMHRSTYLRQNMNDYFNFLEGLSCITPYYDFSGINFITTNNFWYYETSHFRTVIGDRIIDKIIEKKKDSFGVLVNKNNIERVLKTKKAEIENYTSKQ